MPIPHGFYAVIAEFLANYYTLRAERLHLKTMRAAELAHAWRSTARGV